MVWARKFSTHERGIGAKSIAFVEFVPQVLAASASFRDAVRVCGKKWGSAAAGRMPE